MSKTITVFGATGQQGGGVVQELLKDGKWKIRAVTRNTSSDKAKALATQGVEVVSANLEHPETLKPALEGSHAVFGVTNYWEYLPRYSLQEAHDIEVKQGIELAKAVATLPTLEHYLWSSLPSAEKTTNGKHSVLHIDGKRKVDDYIKAELPELAKKTTYVWLGYYASNMVSFPMTMPGKWASTGTFIHLMPVPEDTQLPNAGDASANAGKFAKRILEQPELTQGKVVTVSKGNITTGEGLKAWCNATGNEATYIQCSAEEFKKIFWIYGEELWTQLAWNKEFPDAWEGPDVLTWKDVGVNDFVGFEEALKQIFASGVPVPK